MVKRKSVSLFFATPRKLLLNQFFPASYYFSFLGHMISTPCSRTPSICIHHTNITSHTRSSYMK